MHNQSSVPSARRDAKRGETSGKRDLMTRFDGVIIGAGHNSLTLGAYLARCGLKIGVFERSPGSAAAVRPRSQSCPASAATCIRISTSAFRKRR